MKAFGFLLLLIVAVGITALVALTTSRHLRTQFEALAARI